jgi:hypothetical protein
LPFGESAFNPAITKTRPRGVVRFSTDRARVYICAFGRPAGNPNRDRQELRAVAHVPAVQPPTIALEHAYEHSELVPGHLMRRREQRLHIPHPLEQHFQIVKAAEQILGHSQDRHVS